MSDTIYFHEPVINNKNTGHLADNLLHCTIYYYTQ